LTYTQDISVASAKASSWRESTAKSEALTDASVWTRSNYNPFGGRQHALVLQRDERFGDADQAAVLRVLDVEIARLAGVVLDERMDVGLTPSRS